MIGQLCNEYWNSNVGRHVTFFLSFTGLPVTENVQLYILSIDSISDSSMVCQIPVHELVESIPRICIFFTCIDLRQHVYLAVKFKIYEMYFTCMILGLRHVFLPETKVVWSAPPLQRIPGDRKHRAWPQTDGQNLGTRPVHNQRKDRQIPYCHCTQQNDVHISRRIGAVQC